MRDAIPTDQGRAAMCVGKERYETPQLAAKVCKRRRRSGLKVEPYRCLVCSSFHLGFPTRDITTHVRRQVRTKARLHVEGEW